MRLSPLTVRPKPSQRCSSALAPSNPTTHKQTALGTGIPLATPCSRGLCCKRNRFFHPMEMPQHVKPLPRTQRSNEGGLVFAEGPRPAGLSDSDMVPGPRATGARPAPLRSTRASSPSSSLVSSGPREVPVPPSPGRGLRAHTRPLPLEQHRLRPPPRGPTGNPMCPAGTFLPRMQ